LYITTRYGKRVKSPKYREFAASVNSILSKEQSHIKEFTKLAVNKTLGMSLHYEGPDVFTKQGLPSQKGGDVGGYEKAITDLIFAAMPGLDDKQIFTLNIRKSFLKKKITTIEIWALD